MKILRLVFITFLALPNHHILTHNSEQNLDSAYIKHTDIKLINIYICKLHLLTLFNKIVFNKKYKKPTKLRKFPSLIVTNCTSLLTFQPSPSLSLHDESNFVVSEYLKKFGFGNHMHFSTTEHSKDVFQQTQL